MRKRIESAVLFFVDYGPLVLTIGFAAYVIALSQTTVLPVDTLLQWVLAILGLLATATLVERWRNIRRISETTERTLSLIEKRLSNRPSADEFFYRHLPPLQSYIEKATDIHLTGVALQRTIRENLHVLGERMKEETSLRVVIIDPDGQAAHRLTASNPYLTPERLHANIQATEQNLDWLKSLPEKKGTVELQYIDVDPHFNIIAIDVEKDYGVIFVEIFPQRRISDDRPRFELRPARDNYWYGYFRNQLDAIWKDSGVKKPTTSS